MFTDRKDHGGSGPALQVKPILRIPRAKNLKEGASSTGKYLQGRLVIPFAARWNNHTLTCPMTINAYAAAGDNDLIVPEYRIQPDSTRKQLPAQHCVTECKCALYMYSPYHVLDLL